MDSTPIIFLSAKDTVEDRINGLTVGADDYIVKPFLFQNFFSESMPFSDEPKKNFLHS